jgi:hypothetical protein
MAQTPTKYELAINIKKALGPAQVARCADSNKRTDVALWPCVTSAVWVRRCITVREMKEDPSRSAIRC